MYSRRPTAFIHTVVIISTDGSFDADGVIAGEDGGCFRIPGFPTVFFSITSIFASADDTLYKFSIKMSRISVSSCSDLVDINTSRYSKNKYKIISTKKLRNSKKYSRISGKSCTISIFDQFLCINQ